MVSPFRPIQPAAQLPLQHHNLAGSRGACAVVSGERLGKRIRSVGQACQDCRQSRVKCDGRRPQCGTCIAKGRFCRYESQGGRVRKAALKSRLQAFEKLFYALQVKPGEEADRLLQQIRCADDFRSLPDLKDDTSPLGVSGSTCISHGASSLSSSATGSEEQSLGSVTPARKSALARLYQESHVGDDTLGKAHVTTHSPALRELAADASAFLISLVIPSASITQAAVDSFFSSSGKLFHVFSREQVLGYYKDVFGSDGCPIPSQKTAVCCLAAVAAVGVQYNAGDFDVGIDGVFYDVARHFFGNFIEEQPLDAIKVCALLAMYNIMNKTTASLAYIEVGLSMSKRHNLNDKCYSYAGLSPEEWVDYRRTWRTLMFFSSWLSSTLGYISGGDISFREVVPLVDVEADHSSDVSHIVQTEMTKISLLNADILRMHLSSKELTSQAMDSIHKDLQDWHNQLPSQMRLANLCREDLPVEVRRSMLGTHLLYLGTTMLLYRRIASQFVWTFGIDPESRCDSSKTLGPDTRPAARRKGDIQKMLAYYLPSIYLLRCAPPLCRPKYKHSPKPVVPCLHSQDSDDR
ncbi:Regulatory protein GAL4 like [Verticillium longisporum]|uniref:Regulatory protein GAL4 like n=1 Tax=Verticillium longisporum TaxID=100787 RepID=A0A8I3ARS0_VERLO|nr:Regulatory protein GAL4 like [Verticillium longisporum]